MVSLRKKNAMISGLVSAALEEDLGSGDVTARALIPDRLRGKGKIIAKAKGVVAGMDVACRVFKKVNRGIRIRCHVADGARVKPGKTVMTLTGRVVPLLEGERTALNFLQHLSGVATLTARFVEGVAGTRARILDTRKTVPGLRMLEKEAVKSGGGENHRIGLFDMILIKDNHLAAMEAMNEKEAVGLAVPRALRAARPGMKVQVEVTSLDGALEAGRQGAHMVLLDNMTPREMGRVMKALAETFGRKRPLAEASGGISLANVRKAAASGVDRISIGALTHSAPALDMAMYIGFD